MEAEVNAERVRATSRGTSAALSRSSEEKWLHGSTGTRHRLLSRLPHAPNAWWKEQRNTRPADERYTGKNNEHHSSNMSGQLKIIPLLLPPPLPRVLEIQCPRTLAPTLTGCERSPGRTKVVMTIVHTCVGCAYTKVLGQGVRGAGSVPQALHQEAFCDLSTQSVYCDSTT